MNRRPLDPMICGVRLSMLLRFYAWRLRRQTMPELLAGGGIAVGVALVFGVLLASTSLIGSAGALLHGLTGSARLQLTARSGEGFDERLAVRVRALPDVQAAAGLLRRQVTIVGPRGRESLQLIGLSPNVIQLGILGQREPTPEELQLFSGLGVPAEVAAAIGVGQGSTVTLLADGRARVVHVRGVLAGQLATATKGGTVALTLLSLAQMLTGEAGRITQLLVEPRPGYERVVAQELERVAGGRLAVEPAGEELRLLRSAAKPTDQSTTLFAAIGGMVGFLLALNAMLLTVPERRRFIADLRMQGFDPRQVLLILGFQALALGVAASLVGIALGIVLSHTLLHRVPLYLAVAFPLSGADIVHVGTVLLAVAAGVGATLLAALPPLLDLRRGRPADAVFRAARSEAGVGWRAALWACGAGLMLVAAVTVLVLVSPRLTIAGGMALALAAICLIPATFGLLGELLWRLAERLPGSMLAVAVSELRSTATRSIALAGVAALAIYGSVAIGGARADLLRGIDGAINHYFATAPVWVVVDQEIFNTNAFAGDGVAARVARVPGVAAVRAYQGGLLDLGARRLWVRARPPSDPAMLEAGQVVSGNLAQATALIRRGGWLAISSGPAAEHHLRVGDSVSLPTPSGSVRFGVAAIMTNSGWPPGAITLNARDYSRYWRTSDPTALEVALAPGADAALVRRRVAGVLGGGGALLARTASERASESDASAQQGLRTLGEISTLLLIAAALSVASALTAVIWQRRPRLASLRIQGFDYLQLWRALLLESLVLLGVGACDGVLMGVYGHALASRWLKLTTGFPAPFSLAGVQVLGTLLVVAAMVTAVIAVPGLRAARVPVQVGLQE
jgi:putative ABC transport system permease protein